MGRSATARRSGSRKTPLRSLLYYANINMSIAISKEGVNYDNLTLSGREEAGPLLDKIKFLLSKEGL